MVALSSKIILSATMLVVPDYNEGRISSQLNRLDNDRRQSDAPSLLRLPTPRSAIAAPLARRSTSPVRLQAPQLRHQHPISRALRSCRPLLHRSHPRANPSAAYRWTPSPESHDAAVPSSSFARPHTFTNGTKGVHEATHLTIGPRRLFREGHQILHCVPSHYRSAPFPPARAPALPKPTRFRYHSNATMTHSATPFVQPSPLPQCVPGPRREGAPAEVERRWRLQSGWDISRVVNRQQKPPMKKPCKIVSRASTPNRREAGGLAGEGRTTADFAGRVA